MQQHAYAHVNMQMFTPCAGSCDNYSYGQHAMLQSIDMSPRDPGCQNMQSRKRRNLSPASNSRQRNVDIDSFRLRKA
jgi:hypothetical protein